MTADTQPPPTSPWGPAEYSEDPVMRSAQVQWDQRRRSFNEFDYPGVRESDFMSGTPRPGSPEWHAAAGRAATATPGTTGTSGWSAGSTGAAPSPAQTNGASGMDMSEAVNEITVIRDNLAGWRKDGGESMKAIAEVIYDAYRFADRADAADRHREVEASIARLHEFFDAAAGMASKIRAQLYGAARAVDEAEAKRAAARSKLTL